MITINTTERGHITMTQDIEPQNLLDMRKKYADMIAAIDHALDKIKQQKTQAMLSHMRTKKSKQTHNESCIQLARIIKRRGLTLKQAQTITKTNITLTRDAASYGRVLASRRKKQAINRLYAAGCSQKKLACMFSYSRQYIKKIIHIKSPSK